jgi:large subunit ribosomal protein L33
MAKKSKVIRENIILECVEAREKGLTPSRYVTQKNRRNTTGRLELKKYNHFLRKHTLHREVKK